MPGKLTVTYELPTRDIHVIDAGPFTTQIKAPRPATATLKPSRRGFTLIIDIETDDPTSASAIADSYAAQLAEHLTLWCCDRVKKALVAKRTDRQFQGTDPNTLHAFPGELMFVGQAFKVLITPISKVKTLQVVERGYHAIRFEGRVGLAAVFGTGWVTNMASPTAVAPFLRGRVLRRAA